MKKTTIVFAGIMLAACSSNPQPASPAPAAVPAATAPAPATATTSATTSATATADRDLSGTWDFTVDAGGQVVPGEITLTRATAGYSGMVIPQGMNAANITSVRMAGERVTMQADTPDGQATFDVVLAADGRTMTGTVAFQGQTLPFNARRR